MSVVGGVFIVGSMSTSDYFKMWRLTVLHHNPVTVMFCELQACREFMALPLLPHEHTAAVFAHISSKRQCDDTTAATAVGIRARYLGHWAGVHPSRLDGLPTAGSDQQRCRGVA